MREEISAGGITFKKDKGKDLLLLLKDQNDNWTFPKGLIEPGEDKKDAARREVIEETGISQIELFKELTPIQYWYRWEGDLIKKTVYYFLFEAKGGEVPKPQQEEGISQVGWFSPIKAWEMVGYRKTNKKVLEEVFKELNVTLEVQNGMAKRP